jgi:hypothetical protein
MNNPKATSILNEILTKLSAITSIEDSPASEQVNAVAEELSEVVVEEVLADAIAESPEVSEEVVEAAAEGSEEVLSEKSEEVIPLNFFRRIRKKIISKIFKIIFFEFFGKNEKE